MILEVSIISLDSMIYISTRFQELVRSLSPTSRSFLHCPCDLSMKYFEAHSFTASTMGVIASLVFLTFSLCVKSNSVP